MKKYDCGHLSVSEPHPDECTVCHPSTEMNEDEAAEILSRIRESDDVLRLADEDEGICWEGRPVQNKWRFVGDHNIETDDEDLPEGSARTEIDDRIIREAMNVYPTVEVRARDDASEELEAFLKED